MSNRLTDRQTDTDNYSNPRCACAPRVKYLLKTLIHLARYTARVKFLIRTVFDGPLKFMTLMECGGKKHGYSITGAYEPPERRQGASNREELHLRLNCSNAFLIWSATQVGSFPLHNIPSSGGSLTGNSPLE